MATHGAAREDTIRDLRALKPFSRSGFAMRGVEGKGSDTGRLEGDHLAAYKAADIVYTVYSYATPIAWVKKGGMIVVPSVSYSPTTSHHQGLCRTYLNQ